MTNISLPEDEIPAMRKAAKFYKFETLGAYFRMCARTLIEHHARGDELVAPFKFETSSKNYASK